MPAEISPDRLVPFRWPTGWTDPSLIRLLEGGPVNCLVVDGSAGAGSPLADAARKAGLLVRARTSLDAAPLARVKWNSPAPIVAISELVWPRVKMSQSGEARSGPTAAPWIDSNCWVARLARVRAPGKTIWLDFEPPKDEVAPGEAAYRVAVSDSAAAGARWLVSLHEGTSKGLLAGNAGALKTWRGLLAALAFFEAHHEWASYQPWGVLGVLSTFAGTHEFLGVEVLNLAARRGLQYRILDRAAAASSRLDGLKAVLYVDSERPSPDLKARLAAFGGSGGLLIVPRLLATEFPRGAPIPRPVAGYDLCAFGKGRLAIAARDWEDPYFLAADTHGLLGRRHDPVLMFNAGSLWQHYSIGGNGRGDLLQLVGFTGRSGDSVSVGVTRPSRSAALYLPESAAPALLKPEKVDGRLEYYLPPFSSYAALELEPCIVNAIPAIS